MSEYYREDGCPVKCIVCQSTKLKDKITDTLDGHLIMEYAIHCEDCGSMVGYWAHGWFDPFFNPDFEGNVK